MSILSRKSPPIQETLCKYSESPAQYEKEPVLFSITRTHPQIIPIETIKLPKATEITSLFVSPTAYSYY